MLKQHLSHITLTTLQRIAKDFHEALFLETDIEPLMLDRWGWIRPYHVQVYLTPGVVKDFFEIKEPSQFLVKGFIFSNEDEKIEFLQRNEHLNESIQPN